MKREGNLEEKHLFYIIDLVLGIIIVILMVIFGIYFPVGWTL